MGPLLCSLGLTWPLLSSRHSRPQVLQGPLQNGPFSIAAAWKTRFVTLGPHLGSPGLTWPLLGSWRSRPQVQNGPFSIAAAQKIRFVTLGPLLGSPGLKILIPAAIPW